ncbi:MAG: tRNA epoxyqueuosine(34) reductase QueG [Nitrospinae bacterium]|nr:tRNA epoxyqueuosine(34) reductase QueG [Nitrospinota bacterium]MBL7019648.1 tRNA epoxyqueuosine(34) reductase QueG [Nitrospinaceae bacterium]
MNPIEKQEKLAGLRSFAENLGFDGFGVAGPELGPAGERFGKWLDAGYDGEMAYIRRGEEKRKNPDLVLEGVKSILCFRTNYYTMEKDMSYVAHRDIADISIYALNKDYHDTITPRLRQMEEKIQQEFEGCRTRVYVDTGPILEKPLAQQAGLGWIGKHTNLLTQGAGSWYFLSEILTDVDLPPSQPADDHCGTCRSCIDICPTDAIIAPYVLDSKRCISYLTIELKGVIPIEFRKAIGNRIYGCDDCQIVCPWNSYAVKTDDPDFQQKQDTLKLMDLIQISQEIFSQRFKGSPIKRIKRRGLLRNAAVALGNSGNRQAIPILIKVLDDEEPLIRAHVVWALGELSGAEILPVIREKLNHERAAIVLEELERVIARFI